MSHFKCAESDEHIAQANIQAKDVKLIREYFDFLKIDYAWQPWIDIAIEQDNKHALHDAAHYLFDFLVVAHDKGIDSVGTSLVDRLRVNQTKCKGEL